MHRSRDGSLRFQQVAATGGDATGSATGAATGGATGGVNTAKTKDEILDKKEEMNASEANLMTRTRLQRRSVATSSTSHGAHLQRTVGLHF